MTGGTNGTAMIGVDTKQWKRETDRQTDNVLTRSLVSELRTFPATLPHPVMGSYPCHATS